VARSDARVGAAMERLGAGVSSLRFSDDGMNLAVGTSTGHVAVYDVRASAPLLVRDHRNGAPIHSLKYHSTGNISR
jgi:WD40 repeat protein